MEIFQISAKDRRSQNTFIEFPFKLYRNTPQWVPPIKSDMRQVFRPHYAFYQYGEAAFFLAISKSGEVLGRLAVANNHRYNHFHKTKTAFFYYFECIEDDQVANALFAKGFEWVEHQGLDIVLGPKGFTVLDGFGLLIKGFEHRPAFGQAYNPQYYAELIESQGFTKVKDNFSAWVDKSVEVPEKIVRAAELVKKRRGYSVPLFKSKADLRKVVNDIQKLYNESLAASAGNPPITDEDMTVLAKQLLWIADPRLIKIIYKGEETIGWLLVYPDIGAALQRIKGRLFPFGWYHILRESKHSNWIDINGIGIVEEHQRLGATSILYHEFYQSIIDSDQYNYAEILQIREDNINSLMEVSNIDVHFHKTHRLYEKVL